ncbi:hypothetical protein [Serratia sp. PL7]|uniref:hypothetical protein n=1 Tax=Serratia sp. PL7 TaxID=2952201 RepID=UPI0019F6FBBE|nr:hypothetical protein [Serratia sp. PL7]MBE0150126.1 hypothetical protein [Serratia fonticola]
MSIYDRDIALGVPTFDCRVPLGKNLTHHFEFKRFNILSFNPTDFSRLLAAICPSTDPVALKRRVNEKSFLLIKIIRLNVSN